MTDAPDAAPAWREPRLTPESVASRSFGTAKRGYDESEVRAYLRMVADDLAAASARERDLNARLRELEARASQTHPVLPDSDEELMAALGEETARVLGQAREAARELRGKAEEHARRVVRDAQETARELRTTTQQVVEAKTREAEDAARARAKEIVSEARALRDRILADLNERKTELERQIVELRAGRGRLVETYQLVERALAHASRILAEDTGGAAHGGDEATAPDAAPVEHQPVEHVPVEAPPAEPAAVEVAVVAETVLVAAPVEVVAPPADDADHAAPAAPGPDAGADGDTEPPSRDVGALFERLRAGAAPEPGATAAVTTQPAPAADATEGADGAEPAGESDAGPDAEPEGEPGTDQEPEKEPAGDDPLAARDAALAGAAAELATRGKRALQDEQNDVLDGLRRQRGKIDLTAVLPAESDQLARWAHVLQPAVDRAYVAGAATVGAARDSAPGALLTELATAAVAPLRDRLSDSLNGIETRSPAYTELAVAQRLGARYREWRSQDLDRVLGDALASAYARGVYDAAPAGSRLRWVAAREGKCPDCDDNALEPTVRGEEFPTGQAFPPAHPGCRCTLVVEQGD